MLRRLRPRSLRAQFLAAFLLLSVVPLSAGGLAVYQQGQAAVRRQVYDRLAHVASLKSRQIEAWVSERRSDVTWPASMPLFQALVATVLSPEGQPGRLMAEEQLRQILNGIRASKRFAELFLLEPDQGRVVLSTDREQEGKLKADRPYFREGRRAPYLQHVYYSLALGRPVMAVSAPIRNLDGRVLGILVGRVDLSVLDRVMADRSGLGQTGQAFLVNRFNYFVSDSLGRGRDGWRPVFSEGVRRGLSGEAGTELYRNHEDRPVAAAYRFLPDLGLAVIAELDQAEAFRPVQVLQWGLIATLAVVSTAAILLALALAFGITRPLERLMEAARRIGKGDLTHRVDAGGPAEVTTLNGALNAMAEELLGSRRELEAYSQTLERRVQERTEALARSEANLRLLFTSNPLPMWVYDLETLDFLEVNPAALAHYGYSREEFLGLRITDIRPREDVERLSSRVAEVRRTREARVTSSGPWRHRLRDGRVIEVEVFSHPVEFGGRSAALVVALDITRRQQAEEALRRSEEYFRSLLENALDIITILDSDGRFRYGSPSLERVLGYPPEELHGRSPFEFIHPEDAPKVRDVLTRGREIPGDTASLEFRVRHKDGSWRMLEAIGRNLLHHPAVAGAVINSRDVTERVTLEAQLRQSQKMEAIGQLAGGIAHDFNNLLTIIAGRSELLQARLQRDDPARRDVDLIQKTANRAASLTRQLLAFSRKQVLRPRVLNLNAVVAGMEPMLRRLIGEDIELEVVTDRSLGSVKADPAQLEQVILNLSMNARDAMPHGGRLTIETCNVEVDGAAARETSVKRGLYVMLAVADTGCGMDAETRARVFEPFFTTKEKGRGTGLGLSTVYGIVEQSGGHVWVATEPGRGSTFTIYLPRAEEPAEPTKTEARSGGSCRGSETVLLVEDDPEVRALAQDILEANGYTVLAAAHPLAALQTLSAQNGPADLLLTDVVMPGMSGQELAERLAATRPGLKILYMSGYTDDAIARHGVLEPGTVLLEKPFTPDALLQKVREVLDA